MNAPGLPPKPYDAVESAYIRQVIAAGDFDDPRYRRYVNDLVRLEQFITEGVTGFVSGMAFGSLRNAHSVDFVLLWQELGDGPLPSFRYHDTVDPDDDFLPAVRQAREQWRAVAAEGGA